MASSAWPHDLVPSVYIEQTPPATIPGTPRGGHSKGGTSPTVLSTAIDQLRLQENQSVDEEDLPAHILTTYAGTESFYGESLLKDIWETCIPPPVSPGTKIC